MHEIAFADAARPTQVVCLRLPLRPFTIGHQILLHKEANPLACLSRDAFNQLTIAQQIAALQRAVLICARNWADQETLPPNFRHWQRLIGYPVLTWFGKTLIPPWHRTPDWPVEIAEFRNYLEAADFSFPGPTTQADEVCAAAGGYDPVEKMSGRPLGAPLTARLFNSVCRLPIERFGLTSIYDFPWALAVALHQAELETTGGLRIENATEHEERVNWEQIVAETKAEEAAEAAAAASPSTINQQPSTSDNA